MRLPAAQGAKTADALRAPRRHIEHRRIAAQRPRLYAQIRLPPALGIGDRLERLGGECLRDAALHELSRPRLRAEHRSRGRRQIGRDAAEELFHADIRLRRAAENREDFAVTDALDERLRYLRLLDGLALEVFFHERVVIVRDRLDEGLARRLDICGEIFRDLRHDAVVLVVRHDLAMHREEVDDALERGLLADGQLHGHDARAETHTQLIDDSREVRVLAVHLVEEERAGEILAARELPELLRLHLDAGRRGEHAPAGMASESMTRFSFSSPHSQAASFISIVRWRAFSSGSTSSRLVPSSTLPQRFAVPV